MTDKLYATDAYARDVDATVVDVDTDDGRVLLDRTVFYPGGGGQPHDVGALWIGEDRLSVTRVANDGDHVWHWVTDDDGDALPTVGTALRGELDWDRRLRLMRVHTAMHALCGVIFDRFGAPVTGGNMQPGSGRLDFELPDWDNDRDRPVVEQALNDELARQRPVEVAFLPREVADLDPSLIRTKVSLLPDTLRTVRVIDIVGLDRQADGGTHVSDTGQVGAVTIPTVKSKGRGFRRIRVELEEMPR